MLSKESLENLKVFFLSLSLFDLSIFLIELCYLGVSDIDANLETKIVTVTCREDINEQDLLAALQKWGTASGKSVALYEQSS